MKIVFKYQDDYMGLRYTGKSVHRANSSTRSQRFSREKWVLINFSDEKQDDNLKIYPSIYRGVDDSRTVVELLGNRVHRIPDKLTEMVEYMIQEQSGGKYAVDMTRLKHNR
jgi:hypothetical protein